MISATAKTIRITKILIVFFAAIFGFLVCFGNITDYGSNYEFVKHTLAMDTTFPGNTLMYRAIHSALAYKIFYLIIIALEGLFSLFCLLGTFCMLKVCKSSGEEFHKAKLFAIIGFLMAIIIWYFSFQVVGGEWFAMWQSKQWNGLTDANRFVSYVLPALIFLCLRIDD